MKNLKEFREEIDEIDDQICELIAKRFEITNQIGKYKLENSLPLEDKEREMIVMGNLARKSNVLNINPTLIQDIFHIIINKTKENYKNL